MWTSRQDVEQLQEVLEKKGGGPGRHLRTMWSPSVAERKLSAGTAVRNGPRASVKARQSFA